MSALSPRMKKGLVYGGMGLTGLAAAFMMTLQTDKEPPRRDPETAGLLGGADTRTASLEGLSRRLDSLEAARSKTEDPQQAQVIRELSGIATRLESVVQRQGQELDDLRRQLTAQGDAAAAAQVQARKDAQAEKDAPAGKGKDEAGDDAAEPDSLTGAEPRSSSTPETRAATRDRLARDMNLVSPEVYARPIDTLYATPPVIAQAAPMAPKIVSHESVRPPLPAPEPAAVQADADAGPTEPDDPMARIPDLRIAAGSVMSAFLLTGVDAPTGSRADSNPIPVLMRLKLEARMPNYAYGDIMDCHLIGAAYGDLASERVNIRGETVSCTLSDGQVFDGKVQFFVTGEDGKNGIRGRLVNRSGKMLARTAYASIAQGVTGVLASKAGGGTTLNIGGTGGGGEGASLGSLFGQNAGATAGQGFQRLGDYYMELAEQTFPIIEISNGRWVDVVLTDTMNVKFLRGAF